MFKIGPRIEFGNEGGKGALISNVVIILVGIGLVFFGYNGYTSQNQALENPVNTSATVTETRIDRQSSRRGGPDYQPEITFEYSYEGQDYTSSNMYPGGQEPKDYNLESNAREVVDEYGQGSGITVNVPPENPGEAFISAKKTNNPLIGMGAGVLFILLGSYKFMKGRYI
jgi:hypothetical protein